MNHIEEMLDQSDYLSEISRDSAWKHNPLPRSFDRFAAYQCDNLGTPIEIINDGRIVLWMGVYNALGRSINKPHNNEKYKEWHYPIRFQGQYYDVETQLHYNRYRYYNNSISRFISKDPIGMIGGLNLYSYAPNPINWIDPLGLKSRKCPDFSAAECQSLLEKITQKASGKKDINGSRGLLERVEHLALDEHELYNNAYSTPATSGSAMGKGTYKGHIDAANDLKRGLNRDIDAYHRANCKGFAKLPMSALKASTTLIPHKPAGVM